MKYTTEQLYEVIAEANNAEDFCALLRSLIERLADIRQGSETLETRQAAIRILQDAIDTIRRVQKNVTTRGD